jgi:hypothetical protein
MKRMPKNGSDHFATLTHLALKEDIKNRQHAPKAGNKELKEANKLASRPIKK